MLPLTVSTGTLLWISSKLKLHRKYIMTFKVLIITVHHRLEAGYLMGLQLN